MWLLLLLCWAAWMIVCVSSGCKWPLLDVLFVMDGRALVSREEHALLKEFLANVADSMRVGVDATRIALTQFTPDAKHQFNLFTGVKAADVQARIKNAEYAPCVEAGGRSCAVRTSLNGIAKVALSSESGDRPTIPDAVVVVHSITEAVPDALPHEVLFAPLSPIYAFFVSVGGLEESNSRPSSYVSSAATITFSAVNYSVLHSLVEPLCLSANGFIQGESGDESVLRVFESSAFQIFVIALFVVLLFLLLVLAYALHRYQSENSELKSRITLMESEPSSDLLIHENGVVKSQNANGNAYWGPPGMMAPRHDGIAGMVPPQNDDRYRNNTILTNNGPQVTETGNTRDLRLLKDVEFNEDKKDDGLRKQHPEVLRFESTDGGKQHYDLGSAPQAVINNKQPKRKKKNKREDPNAVDSDGDEAPDGLEGEQLRDGGWQRGAVPSCLPSSHPASALPPVDVLLLVDASSSIGNANFVEIKERLSEFVDNVDVAPGRSRIAAIAFAAQPIVCFGFDKYYSRESVKGSVLKIPYAGGPTFLAKALLFASGVLYQEQNMKDGHHRKHKFMPTPRHDRLQVLIVVSDGYSEDDFENVSAILRDRLLVKVAAIVSRTYNKEKLVPVTRFEGSIFLSDQIEALSIWLWRQQRLWNENYGEYVAREKSSPLQRTSSNPKEH